MDLFWFFAVFIATLMVGGFWILLESILTFIASNDDKVHYTWIPVLQIVSFVLMWISIGFLDTYTGLGILAISGGLNLLLVGYLIRIMVLIKDDPAKRTEYHLLIAGVIFGLIGGLTQISFFFNNLKAHLGVVRK